MPANPIGYMEDGTPVYGAPPEGTADLNAPSELTGQINGENVYSAPPAAADRNFSAWETLKNVPGSAGQAALDATALVHSPIQTSDAFGKLVVGVAQKLWPGEQSYEKYADAVGQHLKDRYGSADKAVMSFQDDPVGVLLDVSSLATGGGGAVRSVGKIPSLPRSVGQAGQNIMGADPINLGKRGLQKAIAGLSKSDLPNEMYAGATKMSTTLPERVRKAAVETALDQQIMPTPQGMKKLDKQMRDLGSQIDDIMDRAEEQGVRVHRSEVFKPVRELKQEWVNSPQVGSAENVAVLDGIMNKWLDQLEKQGREEFSPRDLQDIKTDMYTQINFDRSTQKAELPVEEVKKTIARGTRESIEGFAPEIAGVNKAYGKGEVLRGALERPVSRIANRDMVGLGVPMKIAAGSALGGGGDAGALTGVLGGVMGAMDAPTNKARLALALRRWKDQKINKPANFPLTLSAYQAGKLKEKQDKYAKKLAAQMNEEE